MASVNLKRLIINSTIVWLLLIAAILIIEPNYGRIALLIDTFRVFFAPILMVLLAIVIRYSNLVIYQIKANKLAAIQVILSMAALLAYSFIRKSFWPTNVAQFFVLISFILIIETIVIINDCKIADMELFETKEQNEFDPISDLSNDLLNRAEFCRKLFSKLKDEKNNNVRYALTGEWGSGKSSCLKIIANFAKEEDYPVVEFSSWQYQSKEEAWQGFVAAVDRGIAEWRNYEIGPLKTNNIFMKFIKFLGTVFANNSVGKLLNDLFVSRIRVDYSETKEHVSKILKGTLKDKRLFILIDDFDRTSSDVVLQFFVTIRDIIDLPGCFFICAFDEEATNNILKMQGIENTDDYLRKVFQETIPIPRLVSWNNESIEPFYRTYENIETELIHSFLEFMPINPRQVISYLYHLDTIHSLLDAYEGLQWNLVYLIELARFSFPNEMRLIEKEKGFFKFGILGPFLGKEECKKYIDETNNKLEFKDEDRKDLFWLLIEKIRAAGFGLDEESFQHYFEILHLINTETLSWKEYKEWLSYDNLSLLRKLAKNGIPIDSRREFLKMLLKERDIQLSREADVFSNEERADLLERAILMTEKALWLVVQDELHEPEESVFDCSVTIDWISKLGKWAHFNNGYYEEIRMKEIDLVKTLARKTSNLSRECLIELSKMHSSAENEISFAPILKDIKGIYMEELAKKLLNDLKIPGSISKLWGAYDHGEVKDLFMKANPILYSGTNLERLISIAQEANLNYSIQENFYEMIRLLLYYGVDQYGEKQQELLKDDDIREMYWRAATCRPFQRRAMGSLLESRRKLGEDILHRSDIMPIPVWFSEMEPEMTKQFEISL